MRGIARVTTYKKAAVGLLVFGLVLAPLEAYASSTGQLSQQINAGTISTDIEDSSGTTVASPSFSMTATTVSTSCQTVTGTYGDTNQRIYVDNPGAANSGWTLTIAATGGATATWTGTTVPTNTYAFNDATGSGCTNGQLSLDPSVATLTTEGSSTTTGITQGTAASFTSSTPVTLMSASSSADPIWRGYLTGIGVSQKVPANTPADTYTIDLTQTVAAS